MSTRDPQAGSAAMEALYPFLYPGKTDLPAVLDEVRRSTVAKTGRSSSCAR